MDAAIGGYFELELPPTTGTYYRDAMAYQSARASFLALLRQSFHVKRVWLPYYICNAMLAPVRAAGKEVCFYRLDDQFAVSSEVSLRTGDLLLYVNYFGVCTTKCDVLLQRFDPAQIVLDCSQAFFAQAKNCFASIYSPRKFFGIPDGGLLVTAAPVSLPRLQDMGSEDRMRHLIRRLGGAVDAGYQDFKRSEDSLEDIEPRCMSTLTQHLFQTVNFEAVRDTRNRNFTFLRYHLDKTNTLTLPNEVNGPHCYPYVPDHPVSKENLFRHRVFVATYWPEVLTRVGPDTFEAQLVTQCLPIPCDQRYGEAALSRVLNLL